MKIIASNLFVKFKKKASKKLQLTIDEEVRYVAQNPRIGEMKKGDLKGIRVHKFKFGTQLLLLSYEIVGDTLNLYTIGSHENFYKKLKKYLG